MDAPSHIVQKPARVQKPSAVKNKTAAPVQITAEQILREAQEHQEVDPKPPKQRITDEEELKMFQFRKRKEFEDSIQRNRTTLSHYLKYARWEESQREFRRARSIFERALEVDYRSPSLYVQYAEMEMKHRHVNHARNIWDRAVSRLPRIDQLWYKYAYMEEMLGNVPGARQIFERWMKWEPDDSAWTSYIRLEVRYNEIERARAVWERYVVCHNTPKAWTKYAKFEEKQNSVTKARSVYERALEMLEHTEFHTDEKLYIAFARFEQRHKEHERARVIFKYALDLIPKVQAQELYREFTNFEKQFGSKEGVEEAIISKRRFQYEADIQKNPNNYDTWFDYVRLEEAQEGDNVAAVREVYERAIAVVPPTDSKNRWRRYIYLWINYALFEELEAKDVARARAVYQECLRIVPHQLFSFSKIWILFAHFEVRQHDLAAARRVFGTAIGKAPKPKIFHAYKDLEYQLNNIDRCRKIFEKWLEHDPALSDAWLKYAEMEHSLEETERARALYEIAVEQAMLDMPEMVWKAYIDFEIEVEEYDRARALYRRLLERTKHVKVWISFAQFEASLEEFGNARAVFEEGCGVLKVEGESKEERVMLLESWKEFETEFGDADSLKQVEDKMPRRVKRRRQIEEEGGEGGWEEYFDYIFPDEEAMSVAPKLLDIAKRWQLKRKQQEQEGDEPF